MQRFFGKTKRRQEAEIAAAAGTPFDAFTLQIMGQCRHGTSLASFLRRSQREDLPYYRVCADATAPVTRFRMTDANPVLLDWVKSSDISFDILQLPLSGFQYHWRSDLARVLECGKAVVSQTHLVRSGGDLLIDHVAALAPPGEKGFMLEGCFVVARSETAAAPVWNEVVISRRLTPRHLLC